MRARPASSCGPPAGRDRRRREERFQHARALSLSRLRCGSSEVEAFAVQCQTGRAPWVRCHSPSIGGLPVWDGKIARNSLGGNCRVSLGLDPPPAPLVEQEAPFPVPSPGMSGYPFHLGHWPSRQLRAARSRTRCFHSSVNPAELLRKDAESPSQRIRAHRGKGQDSVMQRALKKVQIRNEAPCMKGSVRLSARRHRVSIPMRLES